MNQVIQDDPHAPPAPAAAPTPAPLQPPQETNRQMQAMRIAGTFGSIHNLLEGLRVTADDGGKLIDLAQQRLGEACHWATTHVFRFGMPMVAPAKRPAEGDPAVDPVAAAAALGAKPDAPGEAAPAATDTAETSSSEPAPSAGEPAAESATAEDAATAAGVQTAV